jgi:phosphotransferase system enzyme I (PtsI)
MTKHHGKGVFPGIAFGTLYILQSHIEAQQQPAGSADEEWAHFIEAKAETDRQLEALFEKTMRELGEEQAMIIDVQRMMLDDGDLNDAIEGLIKNEGASAPDAAARAGRQFSDFFASLDDPYMRARSTDVLDVTGRLADTLLGWRSNVVFTGPTVIAADDLTPSETLQLDRERIAAFVIRQGSTNSHTAILAQNMNIPCLVQTEISLDPGINGRDVIVDGVDGVCYVDPDDKTRAEMQKKKEDVQARREMLESMKGQETVTKSGKAVRLFANIGGVGDIKPVLENDAEGIGIFRSEFLYLGRDDYPTEEELFDAYRKVAEAMGGKQVIIRTLDIGADKQADYFKLDDEENPALGLRGIRICIERPEVFRTQLRAILRASGYGNIAVMFPMIASLWEIQYCKERVDEIRLELAGEGVNVGEVPVGIMIETPAAVMVADSLAKEVDFFSVGTNDMTQYTLAIDRQNSKLGRFFDPHHPAVMEMLRIIAKSAIENGIWAGICGELAADTSVTAQLVEMGYAELSVSPAFVLEVRKRIREID